MDLQEDIVLSYTPIQKPSKVEQCESNFLSNAL